MFNRSPADTFLLLQKHGQPSASLEKEKRRKNAEFNLFQAASEPSLSLRSMQNGDNVRELNPILSARYKSLQSSPFPSLSQSSSPSNPFLKMQTTVKLLAQLAVMLFFMHLLSKAASFLLAVHIQTQETTLSPVCYTERNIQWRPDSRSFTQEELATFKE